MDETEIKLQDARAEITRLNKKLNQVCLIYSNFYVILFFFKLIFFLIFQATTNQQDVEQRFEDISVNFVNAQADLEQREEDLKIGTTNTIPINNKFFFLQLNAFL